MSTRSSHSAAPAPPRVFISYAHDAEEPEHRERVLQLANHLRRDGVNAWLDLYEPSPAEGWPKWHKDQLLAATFVLVVCTARYHQCFGGEPGDEAGSGVRWEGSIVRQLLHDGAHPIRVVPVLLAGASVADVPVELARFTRWELPAQYHDLYRQLTAQCSVQLPALGEVRRFVDNLQLGTLPPVFAGRKDELAEIRSALAERRAAAGHVAIVGLGGVGKTRLALEYAQVSGREYDVRWKLRAGSLASAQEDLVVLGIELRIVSRPDDIEASVDEVRRWLSLHERWLLVLDDADGPESIRSLLPSACPGHVLITSRAQAWRGLAAPIVLRMLPPEEAQDLLASRSGRSDDGHSSMLTKALGYLPLALVQAAAYIEATGESFGGYLELLTKTGVALFDDPLAGPDDGEGRTVARTWALSFAAVRKRSPAAAALLDMLAFLDPDGVPTTLLLEHAEGLPEEVPRTQGELNAALAVLLRFSLVDREADVLRVHRLVQKATRDALGERARGRLVERLVQWLRRAFDYVPWDTPISRVPEGIGEQVMAIATQRECLEVGGSVLARMLGELGNYRMLRGMVEAALEACRRSLAVAEALTGSDPHDARAQHELAESLKVLGTVELQAGDLAAARDDFRRSLHLREALAAADPLGFDTRSELSSSLYWLGTAELQAGNLEDARELFTRACRLCETLAAADPRSDQAQRDLSSSLRALGDLELQAGDLATARDVFLRHSDIARALAEADPGNARARRGLAVSLKMLGQVEQQAGDFATARDFFRRYSVLIEELADADPRSARLQRELALSLENRGSVEAQAGARGPARELLRRSLHLFEVLAKADPRSALAQRDLAISLQKLGEVELPAGDLATARDVLCRSLHLFEVLTETDPCSARARADVVKARELLAGLP
jgi:tetratricopeptide (TPR) repeat protein